MEVVVYSTVASAPGQVVVVTNENETIDSLISSFCTEKGIRHEKEYVIRNQKHQILPNARKLQTCQVENGDILYLGVRVKSEKLIGGCSQWWLLAFVALLIGAAGLVAISILKVNGSQPPLDYGVVIDAGSSHSQIYVYKWDAGKYNDTAIAKELMSCRSKGTGISEYTDNPAKAGESLKECLDSSKEKIPDTSYTKTPLYLGATAGMRLLAEANQTASESILASVRKTMKTYPYNFTKNQAVIISGKDEGAFGWITVNYVFGKFTKPEMLTYLGLKAKADKKDVIGALDMGGASTQITFYPDKPEDLPDAYKSSLLLYGEQYHIYSHSYLCFGLNETTRRYNALLVKLSKFNKTIEDPCRQKGYKQTIHSKDIFEVPCTKSSEFMVPSENLTDTYFTYIGTGNSTECHLRIQGLFDFNASCANCTFNGVQQPPVRGNFVAFSGFYYTAKGVNLTGSFRLADYRHNYTTHCESPWIESNDTYAGELCINAHYVDVLLTKGYKFNETTWQNINFAETIRDTHMGWSLGFMLNVSNIIPAEYPHPPISTPVFVILVVVFSCFIAIAVGFAFYATSGNKSKSENYKTLTNYGSV